MKPHPAIAALRDDAAPYRRAQACLTAALDRWREAAGGVLADLPRLAPRGVLADAPALAALFDGGAAALAEALVAQMVVALRDEPLGHVPARHATDGVVSTLLLGRCGPVTLALAAVDGTAWGHRPAPPTITLSPARYWDVVLAGRARAQLVSLEGARDLALAPGMVTMREGRQQALHLVDVQGCLVWLRLQWRDGAGGAGQVHDRATGALVAQQAGTLRESRQRVMLSALGRMGHGAAAPVMAQMAREDGPADLRWTALREALGLDTAMGFAALAAVAGDAGDVLSPHATALRDRLLAQHPQLERLMPCPA